MSILLDNLIINILNYKKMKKLLFSAVALATLLFAGSCQQEKLETAEGSGTVTFTVEAPGALASKALAPGQVIADGTNVNVVHYAVYKPGTTGEYALENESATPLAQGFVPMDNKTATITFDLLKNQDYVVIFWAQVDGAGHYTLGDLRNISLNTTLNAEGVHEVDGNDETRAAFYRTYPFSTNDKMHEVKLYRPFAQLNLLTTQASLAPQQPGQTSGYTIDVLQSEVSVKGLSTTFNTVSGLAPVGTEEITFVLKDTPAVQGQQTLKVNNVDYHYVAMNYFFVPEDEEIVEVSYSLTTDPGENAISNTIINVPVKENYRTNIIGNLLTTATTFEIVVDEVFNEPYLPGEGYIIKDNGDGTSSLVPDVDGDLVYHEASGLYYNGNNNNSQGVYYVMNATDLKKAVSYFSGQTHSNEANKVTLELQNDIDLAGQTWTPWAVMFITVNGNGHTISNVSNSFFGYAGAVIVNNLTLKNVNASGNQAGTFAAVTEGAKFTACKLEGANTVTYVDAQKNENGIGAISGVTIQSNLNVEIAAGATVALEYNDIEDTQKTVRASLLFGYKHTIYDTNTGVITVLGTITSDIITYSVSNNVATLTPNTQDAATDGYFFNENKTITSAVLEEGIVTLSNRTFRACSNLAAVELPSTLTSIEEGAFQKAGLVTIEIPENVTYIGTTALGACSALETVIIKAKDVTIANYCARGCANLRSVYIYSDNVVFAQDGRANMHFTNQESNNQSSITYYVKNQNVADALNDSVPVSHAKGMKILNIDGTVTYYER